MQRRAHQRAHLERISEVQSRPYLLKYHALLHGVENIYGENLFPCTWYIIVPRIIGIALEIVLLITLRSANMQ